MLLKLYHTLIFFNK